ncbi:hypothetical protein AA0313_2614 [Acetobacter indonesiensis NRIC 0313]|nr:hypothetical protein AA0313_2614 [Acetobacter indonesiensis NRIC 0313]
MYLAQQGGKGIPIGRELSSLLGPPCRGWGGIHIYGNKGRGRGNAGLHTAGKRNRSVFQRITSLRNIGWEDVKSLCFARSQGLRYQG